MKNIGALSIFQGLNSIAALGMVIADFAGGGLIMVSMDGGV